MKFGIYLDIDSLVDTRLTLLHHLDNELAVQMVVSGDYDTRESNEFGYIGGDLFKDLFRLRTDDILQNAKPTRILGVLNDLILTYRSAEEPHDPDFTIPIYINFYPYNVDEATQEKFMNLLRHGLKHYDTIEARNEPVETIEWFSDNVAMVIKYDGLDWLTNIMIQRGSKQQSIPEITLLVPRIKNTTLGLTATDKNVEVFDELELTFALFINLTFIGTSLFNAQLD